MAAGDQLRASINTALEGYLDLFQLRTGGRNPQITADFVQPTMDLQRWYMESRVQNIFCTITAHGTPGVAAGGLAVTVTTPTNFVNLGSIQVPSNELWLLMPGTRVLAAFNNVAGQSIRLGMQIQDNTGNNIAILPMIESGWDVSDAVIIRQRALSLEGPFWVRPGFRILPWNFGSIIPAGGAIQFSCTLRVVRLRV